MKILLYESYYIIFQICMIFYCSERYSETFQYCDWSAPSIMSRPRQFLNLFLLKTSQDVILITPMDIFSIIPVTNYQDICCKNLHITFYYRLLIQHTYFRNLVSPMGIRLHTIISEAHAN